MYPQKKHLAALVIAAALFALMGGVAHAAGPPVLPAGATPPPNHYGTACSGCHRLTNVVAPQIIRGTSPPMNHYGTYCEGCHKNIVSPAPPAPPAPPVPATPPTPPTTPDPTPTTPPAPPVTLPAPPTTTPDPPVAPTDAARTALALGCAINHARTGSSIMLIGLLRIRGGILPDRTDVTVWRRELPSGAWTQDGVAPYDSFTQTYRAERTVTSKTKFQFRFAGDATYRPARSNRIVIRTFELPSWMSHWLEHFRKVLGGVRPASGSDADAHENVAPHADARTIPIDALEDSHGIIRPTPIRFAGRD